jgi:NitT/TauT family transport system substrate-binding protein
MVEAFVDATLRGVEYTIENPDEAVEISTEFVPSLTEQTQLDDAKLVLEASLPLWQADRPDGKVADDAWHQTIEFLIANELLPGDGDVEEDAIYSEEYLP